MIDQDTFNRIWKDARTLLTIGVKHNAIITVDKVEPSSGRYRDRVNIFAKRSVQDAKGQYGVLKLADVGHLFARNVNK